MKSVETKTLDALKSELLDLVGANGAELLDSINREKMDDWLQQEQERLSEQFGNGQWVQMFQGKFIFAKICGEILKEDQLRIRDAYVDIALEHKPDVLSEVKGLFVNM